MKKLLRSKYLIIFSLILIFTSLLFLYFTVKNTVSTIPIDTEFGLLAELPIFWFFSYVIVLFSCFLSAIKIENRNLFLLNIIILTLILFGTPILIESLPRNHDSYWHMSNTLTIIKSHTIEPELFKSSNELLEYNQNFNKDYLNKNPGGFLIFATIFSMAGAEDLLFFTKLIPLLLTVLITLASYILLKNIFEERIARIGTILITIGNIYIHYHLAPATIGIFLTILIFSQIITNQDEYSLVIMLLGIVLILINLPSYLSLALTCLGAAIYGLIFKEKPNINIIILMVILVMGILYFLGNISLTNLVLREIFEKILTQETTSITINFFSITKIIRIVILFVITIISLISILKLIKKEKISFYIGMIFASVIFFVVGIFIAGNLNMDDRAYLILFYGFIILSLKYYNYLYKLKTVFLIILITLCIVSSLTLYDNETFYIFNNQIIQPFNYLLDNTNINDKIIASLDYYPIFLLKYGEIRQTNFQTTNFDNNFIQKNYKRYNFLVFNSKGEYAQKMRGYQENYNILKERLEKTKNKIYSNKETIIILQN